MGAEHLRASPEPTADPTGGRPGAGAGTALGTSFGWEIVAELGRGAGSTVYRVRQDPSATGHTARGGPGAPGDPAGSAEFALKILDSPLDTDAALTAFRREATLLASIDHPGLPRVHEVGEFRGRAYLVMDFVGSRPLSDVLGRGPLPVDRAVQVVLDVAGPLAAIHARGLVHRDIKPANIIVLPDGAARLIDFGLATRQDDDQGDTIVGTLRYSAPEQCGVLKRPVDHRSDLYSLGVLLVECLTGEPPFSSPDVGELLRMHAVASPPDLRERGVPARLAAVAERLLAKDPDDRYLDGEQLLGDLHLAAEELGLPVRRVDSPTGGPDGRRSALAGRHDELTALTDRWALARGRAGGVCVVRGPGGSGKSRLAAEVAACAERQGALVLRGKGDPDEPLPLAPFRAAVDALLRDADALPTAEERTRLHGLVRRCAAGAAPLLAGLTPRLAELLGPAAGHAEVDQPDLFILAVAGFLTELARSDGPMLLVLDDVQWLDPAGGQLLAHLSAELADVPLMVLATGRDDEASVEATDALVASCGAAVTLDLALGPLSDEGVGQLVSTLVPGRGVGEVLIRIVAERSQGNPFMVQEYVRAVVDAGLLRPSWGTWVLDEHGLDALELPQDVIGLVLARMRDLRPATRRVLVTAAALGTRFRPDQVAQVHAVELGTVLDALVEAAGRQLVLARESGDYAFVHDRVREALLDGLSADQECALHLRIARGLDRMAWDGDGADRVYATAWHYLRAGGLAPPADAYRACRDAGRLALEDHAPANALTYLEHAATLGRPVDPELLRLTGTALEQEGRFHEARAQLEAAVDAELDPMLRAHTLRLLAEVHRSTWNGTQARAVIDRGLAELGARPPRGRPALLLSTVAMFLAACLMQWTGLGTRRGTGPAADRERRRCALIAGFHEIAAYVSIIDFEPIPTLTHNLRMLYWVNRAGHGAQYVQSQAMFGLLCANVGLRSPARRSFARAAADPAVGDPGVAAMLAHYRGAAAFFGGTDNGQLWARALDEHGRSLDLAAYGDGLSALQLEACALGRTEEALLSLAKARRRQALRPGEVTPLISVEPIALAITGRHAEAAAALERMHAATAEYDVRGMDVLRLSCTVRALLEQDERGARFDDAVAAFEALGLRPAEMVRPQRLIFWGIAMGRLAQCRAAGDGERPARLAVARRAVRQLRVTGGNDVLRACEIVARSDLLVLEGRPEAALATLGELSPAYRPDAPVIAYEAARTRTRATLALGGTQAARRQAHLARMIAVEQGWPHRAAWLTDEFGIDTAGSVTSLPTALRESTTTAGGVERERLQALQQVSAAAARVLDPRALARIALDETIRILAADRAFLFLAEGPAGTRTGEVAETPRLVPYLGRDASGADVTVLTGYSATVAERALAERRPVVVTGTEQGAAIGAQSVVLHGLRSILAAPLQVEGRVLGVVYLDSQVAKGIFSDADAEILTAITTHIATSMETARAAQLEITARTAQRERDLAERLRGALEHMSGTLDPAVVLARLLECATHVVGAEAAWLLRAGAEGAVELASADGEGLIWTAQRVEPGPPEADLDRLTGTEQPLLAGDVPLPHALAELTGVTGSDWVALPLRSRLGHLGILLLAGGHVAEEMEVAVAMASQGMTAYENATLFTRVQSLAGSDELTGISNRRRFFEEAEPALAAAAQHARPVAAVMVDIDHFKAINDTHGHQAGDDVISTVAARLAAELGPHGLLARYGGEEFALLLTDPATLDRLPERLRIAVSADPVPTRAGQLPVTASVGVARGTGDADLTTLLARADGALYEAKKQGRNRVVTA